MKLYTLLTRTRKRDIYDLYFLAKNISLDEMMLLFEYKYEGVKISEPVILKALSDFEDVPETAEVTETAEAAPGT